MDKRKTRSLVQKGFSIALTATMVAGSLPTAAIAETLNQDATAAITAGLGDVPSTVAATTDAAGESTQATTQLSAAQAAQLLADSGSSSLLPDPIAKPADIKDGTYTVNVETRNAATPSQASMSNGALVREAKLEVKDGKATLTLAFQGMDATNLGKPGQFVYLGGLYYYKADGSKAKATVVDHVLDKDGNPVSDEFSKYLDEIGESQYPSHVQVPLDEVTVQDNFYKLQAFVPVMAGLMPGNTSFGYQNTLLNVDWTSLKSDVAPAYDSAYKIYYKGADATEQYVTGERASFTDKVHVVPQADGTYVVELTAKSLGDAGKLADVKVDGKAVPYKDNEDGSRTYQIPMADVKGTLDFTFGYTVNYGGSDHTMEHPFQLVVDGGTYAGYTATKEFLDEQIASAKRKLAASKKDDAANEAYQKAIDAAQAVSDKQGATTTEYGKAVQDLDAATKTFNAAPDKPAAPTVEADKVYTATGTFYDETGTTESAAMKRFLKPEVEVRKAADGTYEVDVKTIDDGVATAYGLSVSSGFDSTESDVVYSEAKGDNTVATYRLTGDDLSNIKLHVGYEAGKYKGSHNLILKVDAASVKEETVDKTALTDAIKTVPADKGSKTDEAFKTLTAAKAAAQKVADQADATTADVAAAVSALNKAVADFNASDDAKPETGLEAGKTYSVLVAFHKTGTTDDSMAGAYFEPKATVVANEGGTYTVTLTTKLTAEQKGWMSDLKVGGKVAETKQIDDNNVSFTFTVDDISNPITASVYVQPMGSAPSLDIQLDASKAEEVKPDSTLEEGKTYSSAIKFVKDDDNDVQKRYFAELGDDSLATEPAIVTYSDGVYHVTLTFKHSTFIQAVTYGADKAQAKLVASDASYGTTKWQLDLKSLEDVDITITDSADDPSENQHTATIGFDAAGAQDVTVNKDALNKQIADAKAVEQGKKADDAFNTLQDAIATAQAVANDAYATQDAVDSAADALKQAVDTFNSSDEAAASQFDHTQLADGIYHVTLSPEVVGSSTMTNGEPFFDADAFVKKAINPSATITVKDGKYTLSFDLNSVRISNPQNANDYDAIGEIKAYAGSTAEGDATDVTVTANYKDYKGDDWYGNYNSENNEFGLPNRPYPGTVSLTLGEDAIKDASRTQMLKVFIPHNVAYGFTDGYENVALRVNWQGIAKTDGLIDAIASAKKIEQGTKTNTAFDNLQSAISTAQGVIDAGGSDQAAYDDAEKALQKAVEDFNNSAEASKLDHTKLEQGTYKVQISQRNFQDISYASMSDNAIDHEATLEVDADGTYWLTIGFHSVSLQGYDNVYMGQLQYYDEGFDLKMPGEDGDNDIPEISGKLVDAQVLETAKNADGSDYVDGFNGEGGVWAGKLYPTKVKIKVVPSVIKRSDGLLPGNVFVPVMGQLFGEAFGHQDVFTRIDWTSLQADDVKPSVDKTALGDAIASAKKVEQGNKTDDAFKALQTAIADAQKVADDESATQDAVNSAVDTLNKAVETFKASADKPGTPDVKVDKSKLDAAIKEANKVEQGDKTAEAWTALKDAITAAEQVNNDAKADQAKVDAAVTTLNKAVETFKASADAPKPVDTSKLEEAIAEAKKVEKGNKTDEAWAAFQKAISDAQAVVDAKPTTDDQEAVNKATNALEVATKTFKDSADKPETPAEQVDKSKLNEAIESAKKVEQGKKTDAAFKALQAAISSAEAVAANDDADQATVDKATETLNAAVDTFNKSADKTTTPTSQKPTTPNAGNTTKPTATNGNKKLPQTSDPTSLVGIISAAVAGLSAAGIGIVSRMRGKRDDQ